MEHLKKNTQYEILTPNGWENFYGVRKLTKSNYVKLKNYNLICSDNHRILVDGMWKESKELDHESHIDDIELYDPVGVKSSTYFSNGIVSHNCDFVGSSNTLISSQKLHSLMYTKPLIRTKEGMCIYQEPIRADESKEKNDHIYFMMVDVARGQGKDYSAFVVVDVTEFPYKLVVTYRNNTVSPLLFPSILKTVARKYNNAYILIESNDIGSQVADILHTDLEYENLIKTAMLGRKGQTITEGFGSAKLSNLGVKSSVATKKVGCSVLKNLLEEDKLIVEDADVISELTTFIAKKQSFEAEEGHHDDLVMCLVLLAWCTRQDFFKNLTDMDVRLAMYSKEIEKIEDDLLPFGYYFDGVDSVEEQKEDIAWSSDNDNWLIFEKKDIKIPTNNKFWL